MGFIYGLDPLYWLLIGPTMLLALWAQMKVKSNFAKYSKVALSRRITGAEAAAAVLQYGGVHDVKIEKVGGFPQRSLRSAVQGFAPESGCLRWAEYRVCWSGRSRGRTCNSACQ